MFLKLEVPLRFLGKECFSASSDRRYLLSSGVIKVHPCVAGRTLWRDGFTVQIFGVSPSQVYKGMVDAI
jgi:hypothetical protein